MLMVFLIGSLQVRKFRTLEEVLNDAKAEGCQKDPTLVSVIKLVCMIKSQPILQFFVYVFNLVLIIRYGFSDVMKSMLMAL